MAFTMSFSMGVHASSVMSLSIARIVAAVAIAAAASSSARADMIDGEYGLMDQASPGWAEYNPYEGYDDMLGGNQT